MLSEEQVKQIPLNTMINFDRKLYLFGGESHGQVKLLDFMTMQLSDIVSLSRFKQNTTLD